MQFWREREKERERTIWVTFCIIMDLLRFVEFFGFLCDTVLIVFRRNFLNSMFFNGFIERLLDDPPQRRNDDLIPQSITFSLVRWKT